MRRRLFISTALRPVCRRAFRPALRRSIRIALHRGPRRLLTDKRPSLPDLCKLVSLYVRMAEAFERKRDTPSRFETIDPPEEHRRQVEQDLRCAYGDDSVFGRPHGS